MAARIEQQAINQKLEDDAKEFGWSLAKYTLPQHMNDPDSAELKWRDVTIQTLIDGHQWRVAGIVRGKNAFNATIANSWEITVSLTRKNENGRGDFSASSLKLQGEVIAN